MKIYLVMGIIKETKISVSSGTEDIITKNINLSWADNMIGTVPVFNNKEDAEKYADGKLTVMEMETV